MPPCEIFSRVVTSILRAVVAFVAARLIEQEEQIRRLGKLGLLADWLGIEPKAAVLLVVLADQGRQHGIDQRRFELDARLSIGRCFRLSAT